MSLLLIVLLVFMRLGLTFVGLALIAIGWDYLRMELELARDFKEFLVVLSLGAIAMCFGLAIALGAWIVR